MCKDLIGKQTSGCSLWLGVSSYSLLWFSIYQPLRPWKVLLSAKYKQKSAFFLWKREPASLLVKAVVCLLKSHMFQNI